MGATIKVTISSIKVCDKNGVIKVTMESFKITMEKRQAFFFILN
jgi:hypothetical protein